MGLRLWRLLAQVFTIVGQKQISLIAAGVAFFGMFALFPGIAAIIAIFGLLADPTVVSDQLALMEGIIPPDAYDIFANQIRRLLLAQPDTLGWATIVSTLLALWSSRAGVAALMSGLNAIAGTPSRNGFWRAIVALGLTICLVTLAIVALLAVVVAPVVLAFVPLAWSTVWMLEGLRWLIALTVLLLALGLLYRFGPSRQAQKGRWFTVGAVCVVVVWIAASAGLSYYLTHFASYNKIYGSIGAVIGMLLWLYLSAFLILLGAVLNSLVYRKPAAYVMPQSA
ncbi:MAG: YihY/virulence factor BrkB family protein [Yoonia sp.]|nr:YihY/virulence factor BrkB family protein [Yoonia sp.]